MLSFPILLLHLVLLTTLVTASGPPGATPPRISPLVTRQMTTTFGGGSGGRVRPGDLSCPASGFYCLDTLLATSTSTSARRAPATPREPTLKIIDTRFMGGTDALTKLEKRSSIALGGSDSESGARGGGGGGGGGGGSGRDDPRLFHCAAKDRRPRVVTTCPQHQCVNDYCLGSTGPVRVPQHLEGGDGVYCGRTLNRAVSRSMGFTTARMTNGGADPDGGNPSNPREYAGYLDGDEFGYRRDHLYYVQGNQGVDLGPCNGRCMRQAPGIPDYCEA